MRRLAGIALLGILAGCGPATLVVKADVKNETAEDRVVLIEESDRYGGGKTTVTQLGVAPARAESHFETLVSEWARYSIAATDSSCDASNVAVRTAWAKGEERQQVRLVVNR